MKIHDCGNIPLLRTIEQSTNPLDWYYCNNANGTTQKIRYCPWCGLNLYLED